MLDSCSLSARINQPFPHPVKSSPIPPLCLSIFLYLAATSSAGLNLLSNPSAASGATAGWEIIGAGGDGWNTAGQAADGDGASFITSYGWCTRSQSIDLLAAGYSEAFLDRSPPLLAREWFKGFTPNDAADLYFIRVELRGVDGAVLDSWEVGSEANPAVADVAWQMESHLFENYPAGVRQVYWVDGGKDTEFWAGYYGTMLDGAELSFADPAPLEIDLNPGSYPVGAAAGGVAGVLFTSDNPGSTHTYELVDETQEIDLVEPGSQWSYLDDGSDLGGSWTAPGFDDGQWASGFAELGYGDGDEVTVVGGGGLHLTSYFRHRFDFPAGELPDVRGLILRLKRDDGAVVYLNGTEIVRDNMPPGAVAFDTPAAATAADDGLLFQTLPLPADLLAPGENVLAVEIHQVNLTSSDTSFDLGLAAELVSNSFDNQRFTIDGDLLRFAQAASTVPVTVGGNWNINVRTTDDAGNSLVELLRVTGVANPTQPATSISVVPDFVTEGEPVGTVVGELLARDPDSLDYHSFALVSGAGSDDNGQFRVASNRLVTAAVLDDAQPARTIRLRATDRGGFTYEEILAIEVRNVNSPPTDISFSGTTVQRNSPAGTLVGLLATDDPDTSDAHAYSFIPTPGSETVFDFGQQWRFLDDGSDLGASNWTAAAGGFDDSSWKSGTGSFGYGDLQNTLVDFGADDTNKFVTTYFRRDFTVVDPASYDEFVLSVLRDDGVAVYLNGIEVARDSLAPGALAGDFATATIGGVDEVTPINFSVPATMFSAGANTLAAEIHQATANSSDLSFDLALSGSVDASGERYFEIVNGNEIRTNLAFAIADAAVGSSLDLVIRSTDLAGDSVARSFQVSVTSDDPGDLDGDGLPDAWERQHFSSIEGQDGDDDSDNDNQTNREEYVYDTRPNDFSSRLALEIGRSGAASHRLQWRSSAARRYTLQHTGSLARGAWESTPAGTRQGSGAQMGETISDSASGERQFRLLVEIP